MRIWKMWRHHQRIIIIVIIVLSGLLSAYSVQAHASLIRSEPAANAVIPKTPTEVRLWFSEPVEPRFSKFSLIDTKGATVDTLASQVDTSDPLQMYIKPV